MMGVLRRFKKFLKGEHTRDSSVYPSSNYLSQKSPIMSTSSEALDYPERNTPYLRTNQNPLIDEQRRSLQTLQTKPITQTDSLPSARSSYYKETIQHPEGTRSLYARSTTPESSPNEQLVNKLDVMTTQNQTIIELLREINMNLNYKMRR